MKGTPPLGREVMYENPIKKWQTQLFFSGASN
jgi:hypothetical protein